MSNKKNKIFIGIGNIANIHINLSKALKSVGLECSSFVWSNDKNYFYNENAKKMFLFNTEKPPFRILGKNVFHMVNKLLRIYHFLTVFYRYDTFFLISPHSFDQNHYSLQFLRKLKNKRIIYLFTGCVERDINFDKDNLDYICNNCTDYNLQNYCFCNHIEKKRKRIENIEKNADFILAQPDISSFIRNKNKILWFFLADDYNPQKEVLLQKFNQEKLKIIHLPSNPKVKQTRIIKPVLEDIAKKNLAYVTIKEGIWERERILKLLEESHILVNSLGTGYNTLAVEAMARGCIVLNSHPDWFRKHVPEAPIVNISPENLASQIKLLLKNPEEIEKIASNSIDYFNKYHSLKAVGSFYKNALKLS